MLESLQQKIHKMFNKKFLNNIKVFKIKMIEKVSLKQVDYKLKLFKKISSI